MTLRPGSRVGPYEVTAEIGAGGMGVVYRARDTTLHRVVALKVLPPAFAGDAERLARFEREAQLLASLNHPNIAQIYGLEDAGGAASSPGGVKALVMEHVEGPTLAERLASGSSGSGRSGVRQTEPDERAAPRAASSPSGGGAKPLPGPLPVGDAFAIAYQICDALDAAHAQGIVHRDLKPANVKVRPDGTVKLLDFGLAKALTPDPGQGDPALSQSPTITGIAGTHVGVLLGTAAYMSPEQARGRAVDRRADVWAFGCVLYEMLTGQRTFTGDDVAETIGAVIHKEPDWRPLDAHAPGVRRVIQRCLQKDPRQRMRDIGDVRLALEDALAAPVEDAVTPGGERPRRWRRTDAAVLAAVALLAAGATLAGMWAWSGPAATAAAPVRFNVPPPDRASLGQFFALSPDGRHMAFFAAPQNSANRLWVHAFDTGVSRMVERAGTVAGAPFWSHDSRLIGYVGDGQLKKIDPTGGPPEIVTAVQGGFAGGTWSRDEVILFAVANAGIMRVPAEGGTAVPVTTVDTARGETVHTGPWLLPDGRRFLYLRSSTDPAVAGIYVGDAGASPDEQDLTRLLPAQQNALFAPSATGGEGHLLYMRDGTLMARPFDPVARIFRGEAAAIADLIGVGAGTTGSYGHFSASGTGALAYRHAGTGTSSAVWVSRTGREGDALTATLDAASNPRLSPDDSKLAMIVNGDLWVYDVRGRPPIRLTFGGTNFSPLWTPDGRRIAFEAGSTVVSLPADGSDNSPEPAAPADGHFHPVGWPDDGRTMLLAALPGPSGTPDIVQFTPGDAAVRPVVATPALEGGPGASLSPDGRWLAYTSNQTGQLEIWVRPYPGPGAAVRISPNGGVEPVWARHGREIYYRVQNQIVAVAIGAGRDLTFQPPELLFETPYVHTSQPPTYDVAADGRFVMLKPAGASVAPFDIVLNWPAALPPSPAR